MSAAKANLETLPRGLQAALVIALVALLAFPFVGTEFYTQMVARMTDDEKRVHEALSIEIDKLEKQKPRPYASALAIGEASRTAQPTSRCSISTRRSSRPGTI